MYILTANVCIACVTQRQRRRNECESEQWSDWHQAHRVAQLSLARDLHSEWDFVVPFFPLYDRESFTRGRVNIILKHRDTGSNLIWYVAEQAISVLASLSLSLYVCLSILQYQLCTLCVWVLGIGQGSYNCCCYLSCGANTDNAESVGHRRIESGLMTNSGSSYVYSIFLFRLSLILNHDHSDNPNLFFWTLGFCPPSPSCYRLTSDLAAGCSLPVSCWLW